METIDEIGRRAAQAALAEAETYSDVEAGLARVTADEDVELDTSDGGRRLWIVLAAAAAVVAAVAAGVVWARHDPSSQIGPATPPEVTPVPTTSPPAPPAGLGVSYRNPPPLLQPTVFATIDASTGSPVAVAESGGALAINNEAGEAIVTELDGTARRVPIEPRALPIAAGPGDVLYAFLQGTAEGLRVVAVPLSGDRAGRVVAEALVDPAVTTASAGHGPSGIVDRRTGNQLIGYVDISGEPVTLPDAPPLLTIDEHDTVRAADGSIEWQLDIERHPDHVAPAAGEAPPAPTADGGAVYWTGIGPPGDQINVIAVLSPDGSGRWYRLPDEWSVAASDVWGTILTRRVGEQVELATLEPRSQSGPGTTVAPTTVAPTTAPPTVAPPAVSPVAALAEAIGASTIIAREPAKAIVYADGTTTEVATPPGAYVDSDGSLLWWATYTDQPDGNMTSRSTAATLDGTIVCEADGEIHRVRQEADGGYVASVERRYELFSEAPVTEEERAVPNYAVDCESGEVQPIEPVNWSREGGGRFVQRVGDRTFTGVSDSEGNADVANESGVSVNGEDYAGYHEFNDDGSRVVYGDMDALASPHVTNVLRSRDTTTGELLWSAQLARPVGPTHWYGDRIVVPVLADALPESTYDTVVVLDARTGDVITTVPASTDIAFVD